MAETQNSAMGDADAELLETCLDGELSPQEELLLRQRMHEDETLRTALGSLEQERAVRRLAFGSLEPTDIEVQRGLRRLEARIHGGRGWGWTRLVRYGTAVAACLMVGILAGYGTREFMRPTTPRPPGPVANGVIYYNVSITDDAGRVMAVQQFRTLEEAREFSEDLRRWQERQDRLRNGQVTLHSARF